jgi:Protein of unknown function (DUF4245)
VQPAIPAAAPKRLGRSPRDMALSLLVLLVPIFVLLTVYRFLGGESATVVDPSSAYSDAQAARAFPVAVAAPPTGWTAISADFKRGDAGGVLRIGFRSPSGGTAQLVESNVAPGAAVVAELGEGAQGAGDASALGSDWRRYVAASGDHAYVQAQPDRTVVVAGRAPDAELVQLAKSLH